jgi:hypothetical protein
MLLPLMRLYDAPAFHADRARAAPAVAAAAPKPLAAADLTCNSRQHWRNSCAR